MSPLIIHTKKFIVWMIKMVSALFQNHLPGIYVFMHPII